MESRLSRLKSWTEISKNLAEVIALLVAAWWAYDKFLKAEAPGLRERIKSEASLTWSATPQRTHCKGTFQVILQNIGKSDIDVTSTRLRVWVVSSPRSDSNKPILISPMELVRDARPLHDETLTKSLLLGIHRPDQSVFETYSFLFKRETNKIAVFQLEANGKDSGARETRWEAVCGETAGQSPKQS